MKGYSTFLKAPGLEPHHQMHFKYHIQDTSERELTSLKIYSRRIPQPQLTGLATNIYVKLIGMKTTVIENSNKI